MRRHPRNAIGITKPYVRDDRPDEVERALRVNALFPFELGRAAAQAGARVLQIATDCVWAGTRGGYREDDPHDPVDVYGKTNKLVNHVHLPVQHGFVVPAPSSATSGNSAR